mgnify:CR=1 FL=1
MVHSQSDIARMPRSLLSHLHKSHQNSPCTTDLQYLLHLLHIPVTDVLFAPDLSGYGQIIHHDHILIRNSNGKAQQSIFIGCCKNPGLSPLHRMLQDKKRFSLSLWKSLHINTFYFLPLTGFYFCKSHFSLQNLAYFSYAVYHNIYSNCTVKGRFT